MTYYVSTRTFKLYYYRVHVSDCMKADTVDTDTVAVCLYLYSVSQKNRPEDLWQFFQHGWEFSSQILRAYYAFRSMLEYEFLFSYLQL